MQRARRAFAAQPDRSPESGLSSETAAAKSKRVDKSETFREIREFRENQLTYLA
jgi:hypothetical protein